ncbi:MAG: polysaccharide deacetylase family protein [Crocinitomicaceae bacterium]|nr:polysaccharide deacetylase family protein [Crocinitomicaceae bacterium]
MIHIYVDQISPRIEYTFEFIFGSRGLTYALTEDKSAKVDLRYSVESTEDSNSIPIASFMLSDIIERLNVGFAEFGETDCYSFDSVVDPVASIFFSLSRYEEYNCTEVDEYGRFPLSKSIIPKEWLMNSMCDRWAEEIISLIDPILIPTSEDVKMIPSFDIDNTYAYKLKSGKRKWISILKDLIRFDFKRLKERNEVLSGKISDPYDTFDKIKSICKRFPETKVFWLIGKWGKKDRNISIQNSEHRKLIQSLGEEGIAIGLHPSFASFKSKATIQTEKNELESVCGKEISNSRQHFLRFQVSETFKDLDEVGFSHEYSMGFAEHVGFRSGTAKPHKWFDLSNNKTRNLFIHPFAYMDGTLREYMNLSIEESKVMIDQLYNEVKRYGGDFIFIWHNETIGDYGNWKGWSDVLDFTLSLADESN